MTGVLVELAGRGAQDSYLIGNPTVTFFRAVYRRHSNFAVENIALNFSGEPRYGSSLTATVSRNGDLVSEMYFHCKLAAAASDSPKGWINDVGCMMVESAEVEIGGQTIDKVYGDYMHTWNALSCGADKKVNGLDQMTSYTASGYTDTGDKTAKELYVPLPFWFAQDHGLALPLISLQYHEVKVGIKLRPKEFCGPGADKGGDIESAYLYANYIYLDADERKRFARMNHEYLITQLQFQGSEEITAKANTVVEDRKRLNFNHPVKEIIWTVKDANTCDSIDLIEEAKLSLNGHDRTDWRSGKYWKTVQPYEHHTAVPGGEDKGISVMSFALQPEQHQPSGSLNMSRVDNTMLHLRLKKEAKPATLNVYARNYNVLRVMSGMAGLAYSN